MYFEPGVGGQGHVSLVRAAWSAFEEIPGTIIIPQYQINKTKQQHAVFWVLRGSLYAHYPLSPVINQKEGKWLMKVGLRHPRKKERKKERKKQSFW